MFLKNLLSTSVNPPKKHKETLPMYSQCQSQAQSHRVHLMQQLCLRHAAGVGALRLGTVALEGLREGELGHVTAVVLDETGKIGPNDTGNVGRPKKIQKRIEMISNGRHLAIEIME